MARRGISQCPSFDRILSIPPYGTFTLNADAVAAGTRCYFAEVSGFARLRPTTWPLSLIPKATLTTSPGSKRLDRIPAPINKPEITSSPLDQKSNTIELIRFAVPERLKNVQAPPGSVSIARRGFGPRQASQGLRPFRRVSKGALEFPARFLRPVRR